VAFTRFGRVERNGIGLTARSAWGYGLDSRGVPCLARPTGDDTEAVAIGGAAAAWGEEAINASDVCRGEFSSWRRSGQHRDDCAIEYRDVAGRSVNESG